MQIHTAQEYRDLLAKSDKILAVSYSTTKGEFKEFKDFLFGQQAKVQQKITIVDFVADINTLNAEVETLQFPCIRFIKADKIVD